MWPWMQDDPADADVLSDLDQDGAGSDNGEQEEEDGFIVCDGYLSADEVWEACKAWHRHSFHSKNSTF